MMDLSISPKLEAVSMDIRAEESAKPVELPDIKSDEAPQPRKKRKYRSRARARSPTTIKRMRVVRRSKANDRERNRMHTLNDGLEMLREVLPILPDDNKMTKIETLRMALNYIVTLENILQLPGQQLPEPQDQAPSPTSSSPYEVPYSSGANVSVHRQPEPCNPGPSSSSYFHYVPESSSYSEYHPLPNPIVQRGYDLAVPDIIAQSHGAYDPSTTFMSHPGPPPAAPVEHLYNPSSFCIASTTGSTILTASSSPQSFTQNQNSREVPFVNATSLPGMYYNTSPDM